MADELEPNAGVSLRSIALQFSLMLLLFAFWSSPLIAPVKIMVVLFHEMSHGLMAIATGGKVLAIEITRFEGGACETEGGIALLIVSAGYLGSMMFGGTILYLSRYREYVPLVLGLLALIVFSAFFTVMRDPFSRRFACSLGVIFALVGFFAPLWIGKLFLRAVGTVCCVYSIFDIYWDVLAERASAALQNDAMVFGAISGIDPQSIGLIWLVICVVYFFATLRHALKPSREELSASAA